MKFIFPPVITKSALSQSPPSFNRLAQFIIRRSNSTQKALLKLLQPPFVLCWSADTSTPCNTVRLCFVVVVVVVVLCVCGVCVNGTLSCLLAAGSETCAKWVPAERLTCLADSSLQWWAPIRAFLTWTPRASSARVVDPVAVNQTWKPGHRYDGQQTLSLLED